MSFRNWLPVLWCVGGLTLHSGAGTESMAARLKARYAALDPSRHQFLNRAAAEIARRDLHALEEAPDAGQRPGRIAAARYRWAVELLHAGQTEQAIAELEAVQTAIGSGRFEVSAEHAQAVRDSLCVAWLRLGEQENCLAHHHAQSCLFPIPKDGRHVLPRGSRRAMALLETEVRRSGDLRHGWLLNLAAMTVGDWPEKVPAEFLIPPEIFAPDATLPPFPDIAGAVGLDFEDLAGSAVLEDFDNDGDLDVLVCSWGPADPLRYFRNESNGRFLDRSASAGLDGLTGGLNLVQGDYDNDGWVDVLVLRGAWWESQGAIPNSLLRNLGDGRFEDVTEAAGLLSFHPTQTAAWLDFNGDGWLDLFIGNETTPGSTNACELFRNNGDGSFTESAAASGIRALGLVKAVHAGDYDNDGRPDLYLSLRGQSNVLYRNLGPTGDVADLRRTGPAARTADRRPWLFADVAAAAGVTEPRFSFPAWFWDYDQDGWLDLYVSGYGAKDVGRVAADYLHLPHASERDRIYRNNHDGTFTDQSRALGVFKTTLPMAGNFGDLDNDGWPDYYLGTGNPDLSMLIPNRMFRNDRGRAFQEVSSSGGFGHLQKGHGIAFGDLDNDGDQDIYASIGGAYEGDRYRNVLFRNPGANAGWLKLQLTGVTANRAAIGARIQVVLETPTGRRSLWKDVNSGGPFGANPLRQEFGLGDAVAVVEINVRWPEGAGAETFRGVSPNAAFELRQGTSTARPLPHRPFPLPAP